MITEFEKVFHVPVTNPAEPIWASKVERWFQLDEIGIAICNGLEEWLKSDGVVNNPEQIINATLQGCHNADSNFVKAGAENPALFVYTLPSVVVGVIAQFLKWKGPTFNFTGTNAWDLAVEFAEKSSVLTWVVEVGPDPKSNELRRVRIRQCFKKIDFSNRGGESCN